MSQMNLRGAVVMITGGAQGIGLACAHEFRKRGAHISIIDLHPPPAQDAEVIWTQGDICNRAVREQAVAATLGRHKRINVLINNAGVGLYQTATRTSLPAAHRILEVNVLATMELTSLVVPYLRHQRPATIVNISSVAAVAPLPWSAAYCASKAALHSLSRCLQHELAPEGINVLTVVPGIIGTNFRQHVLAGRAPEGVTAIKNIISPQKLARAIATAVENRRSQVYVPLRGFLFGCIELLLPEVMNWYIRRLAARVNDGVQETEAA